LTLLRLASARTFASLRRHRNYRLFFFGQLTSVAGTWMQNIAMAWLVVTLEPHSRGLAVGLLAVCRFGPFTLLGLLADATGSWQPLWAAAAAGVAVAGVTLWAGLRVVAPVVDAPAST